jgi:hypothetical protein
VPCLVAALVPQPFELDGIRVAPYTEYLGHVLPGL